MLYIQTQAAVNVDFRMCTPRNRAIRCTFKTFLTRCHRVFKSMHNTQLCTNFRDIRWVSNLALFILHLSLDVHVLRMQISTPVAPTTSYDGPCALNKAQLYDYRIRNVERVAGKRQPMTRMCECTSRKMKLPRLIS